MEPRHVPQPPPERPCVPPFPPSFMSDGNMDPFLDSYDKVEKASKCLKVEHTWEPNQVMSPGPPVAPVSPRATACAGAAAPCLQDRAGSSGSAQKVCQRDLLGGSGEDDLHDRARTLSRPHNVCPRDLLGGSGETDLHDRACTLRNGPNECQGQLLGGGGDVRLQDRASALSMGPHAECLGGHLPHQARALPAHLPDCGPGRFTDIPRHDLGWWSGRWTGQHLWSLD